MNESPEAAAGSSTEPVEERMDRAGERVGQWVAHLGRRLQVVVARAREQAEDILAEAQSVRRDGQR